MFKFLSALIILLGLTQVCSAKEVYDTNLKIKCSSDRKKATGKDAEVAYAEEISIEIKKIDWNKDVSKPPNWGSMSNIKIKTDAKVYEASLLLSTKQRVAFSYVAGLEREGEPAIAQIYEFDVDAMELKKTSVSLFNQASNKITTSVTYCKKQ